MRGRKSEKPLIGVTPDTGATGARKEAVVLLHRRYLQAILTAGGIPLVLPLLTSRRAIEELLGRLDGVLISGGNFDIPPRLYGEEPIEALGNLREDRTDFELELISLALKRDTPLLGVCGGAQAINVAFGGSLFQDIAAQVAGAQEHQRSDLKEIGGHRVRIHPGTKLRQIVGRETLEVNTSHHQAVKKLGKGLIVSATAEDGVIEGIESPDRPFVLGVQWHPEFLAHRDASQRRIFAALVSACQGLPLHFFSHS